MNSSFQIFCKRHKGRHADAFGMDMNNDVGGSNIGTLCVLGSSGTKKPLYIQVVSKSQKQKTKTKTALLSTHIPNAPNFTPTGVAPQRSARVGCPGDILALCMVVERPAPSLLQSSASHTV